VNGGGPGVRFRDRQATQEAMDLGEE